MNTLKIAALMGVISTGCVRSPTPMYWLTQADGTQLAGPFIYHADCFQVHREWLSKGVLAYCFEQTALTVIAGQVTKKGGSGTGGGSK
jgi:hypothetical protein